MRKRKNGGPIAILVALVTRHYGLTLQEMMQEAKLSRDTTFEYIRVLEDLGVKIHRQKEPVRSSWRTIYRLVSIRGNAVSLKRQA